MFCPSRILPSLYLAILALLLAVLPGCAARPTDETLRFYEAATVSKPYDDVLAELELAITDRNFRITGHNHIGSVIRERDQISFPDYDTLQFCNLTYARQMLEISPAAVAYMPCNVAVRAEGGKVIVTTHMLPTDTPNEQLNAFFRDMNVKLKEIVDFAVED